MSEDKSLIRWVRKALLGLYSTEPKHSSREQQRPKKIKADKRKKRLRKIAHKSRMVNYQKGK